MGFKKFEKGSHKRDEFWKQHHRFEHWYVDNQVYFITARVKDRIPAFATEAAKHVFWTQFDRCVGESSYTPWVTSLLNNHYHTLGYLKFGRDLPRMMQRFHGSVAKLTNDLLVDRIRPFWVDSGHQSYWDGRIRDELQARRAYRYTLLQCRRHGLCDDWHDYPHTRVARFTLDRAIARVIELEAFMEEIPYQRCEAHVMRGGRTRWVD